MTAAYNYLEDEGVAMPRSCECDGETVCAFHFVQRTRLQAYRAFHTVCWEADRCATLHESVVRGTRQLSDGERVLRADNLERALIALRSSTDEMILLLQGAR